MSIVWVVLLLATSVWAAYAVQRRYWPAEGWPCVALLATSMIVASFHLLGYVAMATMARVFTVGWAAVVASALAGIVWLAVRRGHALYPLAGGGSAGRRRTWASAPVLCGLAVFAVVVVVGMRAGPWGFDATWYHLPMSMSWLKSGMPYDPALLPLYSANPAHYTRSSSVLLMPGNAELFGLLALRLPSLHLAAASQAPFALIGAGFVGQIALALGARRIGATFAALAFLLAPIVLLQAISPYADLFVACWLLGGVRYLLVLLREGARGARIVPLLGLSLGLCAGAKLACLYFVALLGLLAAVVVVLAWRRQGGATVVTRLAVLLACFLLVSSMWYVRTWSLTGSPTYPAALRLPGLTLFPGHASRGLNPPKEYQFIAGRELPLTVRWLAYPWTEHTASEERGPGVAFAFLLPGAVLLAGARSLRAIRRRRAGDVAYLVVAGFVAAAVAAWWLASDHEPRHILWLTGLVFAAGSFLAAALRGRGGLLFRCLLAASIVASLATMYQPMLDRMTYRWGNLCTWAQRPLIDFIESLPDGAVFLNDVSDLNSGPCNTVLHGKRLQHSVVFARTYFDRQLDAAQLSQRLADFGVQYIFYWRKAGEPVAPAYQDAARYPVVFEEKKSAAWTTIQRVLP